MSRARRRNWNLPMIILRRRNWNLPMIILRRVRVYKRLTFVDVRTNLPITCVYNVSLWSPRKPDGEWVGGERCGWPTVAKGLWNVGKHHFWLSLARFSKFRFPKFGVVWCCYYNIFPIDFCYKNLNGGAANTLLLLSWLFVPKNIHLIHVNVNQSDTSKISRNNVGGYCMLFEV